LLEGRVAWELRIPNDRSWNGKKVLKLGSDLGLHMWSTGRGEEKKHLFTVESLALFGTLG